MAKLKRSDLYSLEKYSEIRSEFRKKIIAHKENRRVLLGEHLLLLFEDQLIMQYQVQEMLKAEKIFEAAGIEEELDAYNPLIPDGSNWKATMMIQYEDLDERKKMLGELIGIEDKVYMQVEGFDKVFAIADEDISRDNADKTSAVHFLRFELDADMAAAAKQGISIDAGVEHDKYSYTVKLAENVRSSLVKDLD
ncbi:MAG: DUF3501 family protein [Gammaproteobacteria bacterium]